MIDLHAHILPGVDDGPADLPAALDLARAVVANGTTQLATTSHVEHGFALSPTDFAGWRAELQAALDEAGIQLELLQGGELNLRRLPELDDETLRLITLGGGNTVLLEPPFEPVGDELEAGIADLQDRGFDVLLAHPERSPDTAHRFEDVVRLAQRPGVSFQITAGSLVGAFGPRAERLATKLLARGAVHVVASDSHNADVRRPDALADVRAAAAHIPGLADAVGRLTVDSPGAIVRGEPVPPALRVV